MKYILWWFLICTLSGIHQSRSAVPLVINTWAFTNATEKAWEVLNDKTRSLLDALIEGCSVCEREQCDGTVGYGGSPDENGETTLDAMIIDGSNMNVGAVAALRQIKSAIAVAKHVLQNTQHTLLVGEQATSFAEMMGFTRESLVTPKSKNIWKKWKSEGCQPNFWMNVSPDPNFNCGPYKPTHIENVKNYGEHNFGHANHDTIGMIVINEHFEIFAGTSTNGANHKIPGRVGDSPIPGAGAYADNEIGAAVATGDGDVMMRFLPSFLAVEGLRAGLTPKAAAENSIRRIIKHHPKFVGGVVVTTADGRYSASCTGIKQFPFSVCKKGQAGVKVELVDCI